MIAKIMPIVRRPSSAIMTARYIVTMFSRPKMASFNVVNRIFVRPTRTEALMTPAYRFSHWPSRSFSRLNNLSVNRPQRLDQRRVFLSLAADHGFVALAELTVERQTEHQIEQKRRGDNQTQNRAVDKDHGKSKKPYEPVDDGGDHPLSDNIPDRL